MLGITLERLLQVVHGRKTDSRSVPPLAVDWVGEAEALISGRGREGM